MHVSRVFFVGLTLSIGLLAGNAQTADIDKLPLYVPDQVAFSGDWLVQKPKQPAQLYRTGRPDEIVLSNGLVSRRFRLSPNAATVRFDHLATGDSSRGKGAVVCSPRARTRLRARFCARGPAHRAR